MRDRKLTDLSGVTDLPDFPDCAAVMISGALVTSLGVAIAGGGCTKLAGGSGTNGRLVGSAGEPPGPNTSSANAANAIVPPEAKATRRNRPRFVDAAGRSTSRANVARSDRSRRTALDRVTFPDGRDPRVRGVAPA